MQVDFFPSRTLTVYLAKTFVVRILAVLLMLVLVLQMLDLLSESGKILAQPGNGEAELLRYVSFRIPQLVARFLPYSVLLATIITLATLNQNSEVIAMKAAGLSAHQILAPLLLSACVVAGLSFAFNERIVTRATATLSAWQANDYAPVPPESDVRTNIYLSIGPDILFASRMTRSGPDLTLNEVTFYDRDAHDIISQKIEGERAVFTGNGWRIDNPVVFDVQSARTTKPARPIVVAKGLTPGQVMLRGINPDSEPIGKLGAGIDALKDAGRRTSELEARWWHKISGPLSAVLMPLLGAVAGFGLARSGHLFVRAVIGMALGFAYFVVDNAALAMGSFGGYPPFLAAWAPFILFLLLGETVLIRTEE